MRHYAGAYSADQLTLTIYSDQTGYGVDYINKWQRTIVTENGYFSLPSRYKRNVVVSLLDAKAQTVVTFTFVGCWPTGVESYNLEGGNATVLHTTVQLSCDNVLINATPEVTVSKTTQIPDKQSVVDQGQNFTSSFKGAITTAKDTVNAAKDKINSATSFVNTNIGQFKTSVSSTFKDIFG
jgi:hypothetical protein